MLSRVRWRVFAVQNSQACYDHLLKLNTQWRISIKNSVNGNLHHITVYVLSFAKSQLSLLDFPYFISVILLTHFNSGRNRACYKVSHNAWFRNSQTHTHNISDFDWVFPVIPEKLHCRNVVNMPYWAKIYAGFLTFWYPFRHWHFWQTERRKQIVKLDGGVRNVWMCKGNICIRICKPEVS